MKNLIVTILVLLAAVLPARAEPPADHTVPVPQWTRAPVAPPVFGTPDVVQLARDRAPPDIADPDESPWSGTGAGIVELLTDEVRALGGGIDEAGDGLRVSGPARAAQLARRRVAAIDRFLTGRSKVSVQLVTLPPGEPTTVTAGDVRKGLRAGTASLLWSGLFDLRRGEGGLRESLVERSFLGSHSTEVAQQASISEVETLLLRTGRRVYVACRPVSGTEAVVTLSLGLSRAPEAFRTEQTATGPIDLPEAPFLSLTTTTRLAVGQREVIVVDHPFEPGQLAVVVSLQEIASLGDAPFVLVDLAALIGHPDAIDGFSALDAGMAPNSQWRRGGYDENYDPTSADRRDDAVSSLLFALEEAGATVTLLSPVVAAITGSDAARGRARDLLSAVGASGRVTRRTYRLPWSALAALDFFDPLTGTIAADALHAASMKNDAIELTGTLTAPMAARTPLLLLGGTWRRYLEAMQVEIAQGAALVRPVIGTHVDGERLVVRPGSAGRSPWLSRSSSALLSLETRNVEVRRDIEGERSDEWGHKFDAIHTADARAEFALDAGETSDVHRVGETAVIHVWSR